MTRTENERLAVLETKVQGQAEEIARLTAAVKELTDVLNKGKGAWWGVTIGLGTVVAGVTTIVNHYFSVRP